MMHGKVVKKEDIALTVGSNLVRLDGQRLHRLFEWLFDRFVQLGHKPHSMQVADENGKYRSFRGIADARRRITEKDWEQCAGFGLMYGDPHLRKSGGSESWTLNASVHPHQRRVRPPESRSPWLTGMWTLYWSIFAEWDGLDEQDVIRHQIEFAKLTVDDYGYLFFMQRRAGATWYHDGFTYSYVSENTTLRTDEQKNNIGAWSGRPAHFRQPLLRDIYPYNFLTPRYLDVPIYGTSLAGWIQADASRGKLEPLTEKIAVWRPVVENIPAIREALFRAGVMFYWRFFVPPSDTFLHMPGPRPFAVDEAIPEIFRREFYAGRDPKLTL